MKTALLLRHAKSAWGNPALPDHERPLNDRGERVADLMASHIARKCPRPDIVLCSTATRTRQTLAPLVHRLGSPAPPISLEKNLYLASEAALLTRLQALADDISTVLLIGHNEGIGQLAETLAGQGLPPLLKALWQKFPTGALAVLQVRTERWAGLAPGSAELVAFVRPRDLDERA